ncbi:MAG: prepilin-type N-terminal cleavage/methylation domain-containing protein [Phycisphaeraceae bacterium]|nr:prepilin-type N-terminal cleavage/methylation domain-containing protein [Phycisphaeraceae bacterium]
MVASFAGRRRAFSLIELVIVVVIIGIIAAIAIPRMSRGSAGASDATLTANLKVLRNAIDLFYTEHNNTYPAAATIADQLTLYSDDAGATNASKSSTFVFGPYIRAIPALPVGAKKGKSGIAAADAANIGWIYTEADGTIKANCADGETDARGVKYNTY